MNRSSWMIVLLILSSMACAPAEEAGRYMGDNVEEAVEEPIPLDFGGELWRRYMLRARESEHLFAYQEAESEYREALRVAESSLERAATHLALGALNIKKVHQPLREPFQSPGLNPSTRPRELIERAYKNAAYEARQAQGDPETRELGVSLEIQATNNLGVYLVERGRHADAVKILASALDRVPQEDLSIYLYNHAIALYGSDRKEEAVKSMLRAAELERGTRDSIELAQAWLERDRALLTSERLHRILNIALEQQASELAHWALGEILSGALASEGALELDLLRSMVRYLDLAEVSADEFQSEWVPRLEATGAQVSNSARWAELKRLILGPLPEQVTPGQCATLFQSWAATEDGSQAFGELLRQEATTHYRLAQHREALCLYERLTSWPTGQPTDVQYPLALLAAHGGTLDPAGHWLDTLAQDLPSIEEPGLQLLAGNALLARYQRTGQPEDLQHALATWERGLELEPEPLLAARLHESRSDAWLDLAQPRNAGQEMLRAADAVEGLGPESEIRFTQEAVELLDQAVRLQPDDQEVQNLYEVALARLESEEESLGSPDLGEEAWGEELEEGDTWATAEEAAEGSDG